MAKLIQESAALPAFCIYPRPGPHDPRPVRRAGAARSVECSDASAAWHLISVKLTENQPQKNRIRACRRCGQAPAKTAESGRTAGARSGLEST